VDSFNHNQPLLAIDIEIEVAKAAVKVFTKLFQIRIVIKSLSLFSLIFLRDLLQNFPCFKSDSSLCSGKLIKANSVPEKNAESKNKIINKIMSKGSILIN
jgi:hypothetical protein